MYPSVRSIPKGEASPGSNGRERVLSRNLVALAFTSFFTDISSEMVFSVVPLFLVEGLGFSIIGFGLFEGAYQLTGAVARIWGGSVADQRQRHKQTAVAGYSISFVTRLGLVGATVAAWLPAVPFLLADRVGKGLRSSPRDALISLSTAPGRLGQAFGVHRALDTAGAMLGPLIAFAVLAAAPQAFDAVFVVSAIAGAIGVLIIWAFAHEQPQRALRTRPPSIRAQWAAVVSVSEVRRIALAGGVLALVTIGDAFIYLLLQRQMDLGAKYFPLLFVGTALSYLTLAVPVGRLADRVGPWRVFLVGNALLLAIYVALATLTVSVAVMLVCLGLLGAYYSATDGVVPTMVSHVIPLELRASGIAFATVAIGVGRLLSAVAFGSLWQVYGERAALTCYIAALAAALSVAALLLADRKEPGR